MFYQVKTNIEMEPLSIPVPEDKIFFTESQKYGKTMKDVTPNPLGLFSFTELDKVDLFKLLPDSLLKIEVPDIVLLLMDGLPVKNPSVTAHVDYNRRCALNFYIETNGETTHYYKWDKNENKLVETGMFQAKDNDWWLIDTSKLHAVMLVPNKRRTVLSFSFKKTRFDKVKQIFKGV